MSDEKETRANLGGNSVQSITLENGKYKVVNQLGNGGSFEAFRHGEPWRNLDGDKLMLAMFNALEQEKQRTKDFSKNDSLMSSSQLSLPVHNDLCDVETIIENLIDEDWINEDESKDVVVREDQIQFDSDDLGHKLSINILSEVLILESTDAEQLIRLYQTLEPVATATI